MSRPDPGPRLECTALPGDRLGRPAVFSPPDGWASSESWLRAQRERDLGGPLQRAALRLVRLEDGDDHHRVLFAVHDGDLRAECDCDGWRHRDWCAHVASLWWRWCRGRIVVPDLDTGDPYQLPPAWLNVRGGEP